MLSELTGFTLTRTIPDSTLLNIMSGSYKVFGGVIRNGSGQIVAHLANATDPFSLISSFSPINTIIAGVNTFQLSRIGANVSQLLSLAKGTMVLSGLTLGVGAAGFLFLNKKLKSVDEKLDVLGKDVKAIRNFLELQERARLVTALKTLRGIDQGVGRGVREKMLISAKQTLSEIHEKYRELLRATENVQEALPVEEYYTITALGHALCAAELKMLDHAYKDLKEAYGIWKEATVNISKNFTLKHDPERMLSSRYFEHIKTDELIDWLDFSNHSNDGIQWIDNLTKKNSFKASLKNLFGTMPLIKKGLTLTREEILQIEVTRKIVARDKIYNGYVDQYEYFSKTGQKPSDVQKIIESFPLEFCINDCFVLMSSEFQQAA